MSLSVSRWDETVMQRMTPFPQVAGVIQCSPLPGAPASSHHLETRAREDGIGCLSLLTRGSSDWPQQL